MSVSFLVLSAVVAGVILWALFAQYRVERANLTAVARRHEGVLMSGWLSDDALELVIDGVRAILSYHHGSKHRAAYTRIRFQEPLRNRLRVVRDGLWESLKRAFGAEDLVIGDPPFDAAFIVQGSPRAWVGAALDENARARIRALNALGSGFLNPSGVTLEAGPLGVVVAVPRNVVADGGRLDAFVGASVDLFRALRRPSDEGITFLGAAELAPKGHCPVCEHPLGGTPRRCGACATPHHAECWAYFGGCSTYACKENP